MSTILIVAAAWLAGSVCVSLLLGSSLHRLELARIAGRHRRRGGYVKLHALPATSPGGVCTTGLTLIRGGSYSSPGAPGDLSAGTATRPPRHGVSRCTGAGWSGDVMGGRGVSGLPPDSAV